MSTLKILALTRYGNLGASSRLRFFQYFPTLRATGLEIIQQPFFDDATLSRRYQQGGYGLLVLLRCYVARIAALLSARQYDLLWIEKEALPWLPAWLEIWLFRNVPFVLDFDDAVFHNYDQHRLSVVRCVYGKRLDKLMAKAACVVAGNGYLAQRAYEAGARKVELVPTVIDLDRYAVALNEKALAAGSVLRVVWIGSPSTVRYVSLIADALKELAKRHAFELHVIGGAVQIDGVNVQTVTWSEATEVESIAACDIGIMPLPDSPFERGKCGYKLIQYMACGLPIVASPVGVNEEIVRQGQNGFLADTQEQWVAALAQLLSLSDLRLQMGQQGRRFVEAQYCVQVTAPIVETILKTAARGI